MRTIAEKLQKLVDTKESIRQNLISSGVNVSDVPFEDYASKLVGLPDEKFFVIFIDYNGVIYKDVEVYAGESVTIPETPNREAEGLTFVSWSESDLSTKLAAVTKDYMIYPIYNRVFPEGYDKTRLLVKPIVKTTKINFTKSDTSELSINWGDGTTDFYTQSGNVTATHTYDTKAVYEITMWISSGTGKYSFENGYGLGTADPGSASESHSMSILYEFHGGVDLTAINEPTNGVFRKQESLRKLTFSEGITTIGANSFHECFFLKEVWLPDTLETLGQFAFALNHALDNFKLSQNLVTMDTAALSSLAALKVLLLPDSLNTIGVSGSLVNLQYLKLPKYINSIPSSAFACTILEKIVFPEIMTTLNTNAFSNCVNMRLSKKHLKNFDTGTTLNAFPNIVKLNEDPRIVLETDAIAPSTRAEKIIFHGSVIPTRAFAKSLATEIICKDTITSIGNAAFENCFNLKRVIFEGGRTFDTVPDNCFYFCYALEGFDFTGITTIGFQAFSSCRSFKSFSLPETITTMGTNAFGSMYLKDFDFIVPPLVTSGLFLNNLTYVKSFQIHPNFDFGATHPVMWGSDPSLNEWTPATQTTCAANFLSHRPLIRRAVFPANLTSCETQVFWNNRIIEEVIFQSTSPVTFATNTFSGAAQLKKVILPPITTMPSGMFTGCINLEELVLPPTYTTWTNSLFFAPVPGSLLKTIDIPAGWTQIPTACLRNCISIETVTLHSGITTINANAFTTSSGTMAMTALIIQKSDAVVTLANINAFTSNSCNIYVPDALVNDYKVATNWSTMAARIYSINDL